MSGGSVEYTYELWRGGVLRSTGRVRIGSDETIVRRIVPSLEGYPARVVLRTLTR